MADIDRADSRITDASPEDAAMRDWVEESPDYIRIAEEVGDGRSPVDDLR